jgi:hypothetical protein
VIDDYNANEVTRGATKQATREAIGIN